VQVLHRKLQVAVYVWSILDLENLHLYNETNHVRSVIKKIESEEIPKYCSNSVIFSVMQDPVIQAALSIVALPSNTLVIQWAVKLIRDSLLMQVNWSLKYLNPVIICRTICWRFLKRFVRTLSASEASSAW